MEKLSYTKEVQLLLTRVYATFINDSENSRVYSLKTLIDQETLQESDVVIENASYKRLKQITDEDFELDESPHTYKFFAVQLDPRSPTQIHSDRHLHDHLTMAMSCRLEFADIALCLGTLCGTLLFYEVLIVAVATEYDRLLGQLSKGATLKRKTMFADESDKSELFLPLSSKRARSDPRDRNDHDQVQPNPNLPLSTDPSRNPSGRPSGPPAPVDGSESRPLGVDDATDDPEDPSDYDLEIEEARLAVTAEGQMVGVDDTPENDGDQNPQDEVSTEDFQAMYVMLDRYCNR